MERKVFLRNKKGYGFPALFFHLRSTKYDPQVLWEVNETYPIDPAKDGMNSIDGFMVEVKDWKNMSKKLRLNVGSVTGKRTLADRILLIDPALDLVLRGNDNDRQRMFQTDLFDSKLKTKVEEIRKDETVTSNTKVDKIVNDVYPLLDTRTIRDIIQFQLDANVDVIIPPIVPITSSRQIDKQVEKAKAMMRETHILMNTVFNRYTEKLDTMNLLTIQASALKPENFNYLIGLALTYSPSHVGIRLVNFATNNDSQMKALPAFLTQLNEAIKLNDVQTRIHIMNLDHLGYATYCLGVHSVTMPIGADPYFYSRGFSGEDMPEKQGAYYRLEDMSNVRYKELRLELSESNYKLPCHCEACEGRSLLEIEKYVSDWNFFRRVHEVLARDIEIKQFRDSRIPICRGIKDQLARSTKPNYANVIPFTPIINT